jgi:DNA polymerase
MSMPFDHTTGPRNAKLVLVGEAWGQQEALTGLPFMGASGKELERMLGEAGIRRRDCLVTNVLAKRPPDNQLGAFCGKKADVGKDYSLEPLSQGKYLLPEHFPELHRLAEELNFAPRNLIIALGATACWALLGSARIGALRGVIARSAQDLPWHLSPTKVLPTYHPSAVLRDWSLRPIAIADFLKAERESHFPEIRRLRREVLVQPTLEEIRRYAEHEARSAHILAVDIETRLGQITCIGFAASPTKAICVSFVDNRFPGRSFWPTDSDETQAWELVRKILESPAQKLFQNGLYDLQYILRMGIRPRNCLHDTMLLHHSLYPELQKGLGFLGSVYANEASWKLMREHKGEELKRDE